MTDFSGRQFAYIADVHRQIPGLAGLHRMTAQLLAERAPADGRILIVGAGGGLEISGLAQQHPKWSFDGVDPSPDMLALAAQTTLEFKARTRLHAGDISVAPNGPFDAAVCLLVFHHLSRETRDATLAGIHRRLAPGAAFVLAHISFPQTEPERTAALDRHIVYGAEAGMSQSELESKRAVMKERLHIYAPHEEEKFLADAGFKGISQFYAALSFKGWVAYA